LPHLARGCFCCGAVGDGGSTEKMAQHLMVSQHAPDYGPEDTILLLKIPGPTPHGSTRKRRAALQQRVNSRAKLTLPRQKRLKVAKTAAEQCGLRAANLAPQFIKERLQQFTFREFH